jgi:hypothetical protein
MMNKPRLKELLKMAEKNPLSQKPSEILGKRLADEFIEAYAERMPSDAFQDGLRLRDDSLINAAIKQIVEQDDRSKSLLSAYRHARAYKIVSSNLQYRLRKMSLESYPEEVYEIDVETHEKKRESADDIELWRLDQDLLESRKYFAGLKPDEAIRRGSKYEHGSEKDPTLIALAKSYALFQAALNNRLGRVNCQSGIESLLVAKACSDILRLKHCEEDEFEKKQRIKETAMMEYAAAQRTADSDLKGRASEHLVEHCTTFAAKVAIDHEDPNLARSVVEKLTQSEEFYFYEDTSRSRGDGNLAYELVKKYGMKDYLGKVVTRIMDYNPSSALNYGLRHGDVDLVKEAKKRLGKKVSQQSIRLFQQSSKGDKE